MESLILSGRQSALQQEVPLHKMATSSESCHKMAASPEPLHRWATTPESRLFMAGFPEPRHRMAASPEPLHKVGPRLLRLASSLADPPLRSVQAAGITRLLTSPVVLEDMHSSGP